MRTRFLIPAGLFLVGLFASAASADVDAGSVRVRVVGLTDVPTEWKAGRLAVRCYIGTRFLFQTPYRKAGRARWNNAFRAYTAKSNPLVFKVVSADETGGIPVRKVQLRKAPKSHLSRDLAVTRSDEILAAGMDAMVVDFGEGGAAEADAEPRGGTRAGEFRYDRKDVVSTTLCRAVVKWPPKDGGHNLACGSAVLRVVFTRLWKEK
ncbi:MAG: hypothetical protein GXP54_10770 [Deltaproteobacteria bacterium]|nr:hypothetical protein [Deltaproteobacteria bacterium]